MDSTMTTPSAAVERRCSASWFLHAVRGKIEAFFTTYKLDKGVVVKFERWFDRLEAVGKLQDGLRAARHKKAA
jgi:hypothetical protein